MEGAEGPAPLFQLDGVVEHAVGHGQQAGNGLQVGDDLNERDARHLGQAGEDDGDEVGVRDGDGGDVDQPHCQGREVRIRAYSVLLVEDEETDHRDDSQWHEDLDHVDDDVLVNGHLDDHLVPAQHAEPDLLAPLLLLQPLRESIKSAGESLRERRVEQVEVVADAEGP